MSEDRCACGRFAAMPGGMAQIEDGVYHVPAGAPACEVIDLRSRLASAERERDEAREVMGEFLASWPPRGKHRMTDDLRACVPGCPGCIEDTRYVRAVDAMCALLASGRSTGEG